MKILGSVARVLGGAVYGLVTHGFKGFVKGLVRDVALAAAFLTGGIPALLATTAMMIVSDVQAHSRPKNSFTGSSTQFKADPQAPVPYMVGRSAQGGYIVHRDSFGDHNIYQSFVIIWSGGGPVEAIESFQVDSVATAFSGGNAVGDFHDWMWLKAQLGACPEASALSSSQGALPGWGSTYKLSGYAAGLWTLKYDSKKGEKYAGGIPQPLAIIKGAKVYDPRLDSTYLGGSGSCRALNEATYIWSENPWLHALTFALGRFQNGKRVLGVGMPIGSIDVAAFVEAANVADANGWKVGGTVSTADDKWNVLKMMAQAGGGECMQLGAKLSCLVNTPRVSLATITSADLVGRASVTGTQARRDRINGIVPRIRSEAHGWEIVPLDVIRGNTYLSEDGAERTREVDYQLVQVANQAAELAAYDIANAREISPITLPLKPVWMGYKPGDCLTVHIPELGLSNQPCIDLNRELEPATGIVTLSLRSETVAKHPWALGQTGTAPPTPSLSAPDFTVAAPDEDAWAIAPVALDGSAGEQVPVIRLTGEADNTNAEAIFVEYRVTGTSDWRMAAMLPASTTTYDITGLAPGASYEVAVSYDVRGVKGDQIVLGPVTTGDFGIFSSGSAGSQLLADDKFLHQYWHIPAPGGRVIWGDSRSGFAATVPFQASTDFRVYYSPDDETKLPRSTAGKPFYVRTVVDPSGFSSVQVVDDDGALIIDDDGAYVVDAETATFDLEVALRWLNADGTFNSRSIITTVHPGDGLQTISGNAVAPVTGFGVIEFGYPSQTGKAGAWTAYEPWEAEYQPAADVTSQNQVLVELTSIRTYEADYLGAIGTGIPDTVSPRVSRGGVSIKTGAGTSYALATSSGVTATVDNTGGSATKGDITITAVESQEAWIDLTVTVDGVARPASRMSVRKNLGSPPASGGSGSKTASTGSFDSITATSFARIALLGTVAVASGESLYGSASLDYYIDGSSGARKGTVKLRYAPAGTTSWTDIGVGAQGSLATGYTTPEGFYDPPIPGHVDYAQTAMPSAGAYDVEIVALLNNTGRTMSFAGIAAVEAKA